MPFLWLSFWRWPLGHWLKKVFICLSLTKSRTATIIFDILYFFSFGFFSYIFILALNKGEIRSYIIIGEIIGAVFYYFSFGIVAIRLTDKFVAIIKRIKKFIFTELDRNYSDFSFTNKDVIKFAYNYFNCKPQNDILEMYFGINFTE